ncbi:MAG: DUF1833 domain-containing protein [Sphingobacterium sp.]|nr:DUF1833 domain-containing protein [Sphingobacterium sp.]
MTVLKQVFASGGNDVVIATLELSCPSWPESILACNGFEDHVCTTEDGRTLTFVATGMDVAIPEQGLHRSAIARIRHR